MSQQSLLKILILRKKSPLNKAYRYKAPPAPCRRGLFAPGSGSDSPGGDSPGGERIRPSPRRTKHHPEPPLRPPTRHPTDTLEPCTES